MTQLLGPPHAVAQAPAGGISDKDFRWICEFLRRRAGIELRPGKETMVLGRLERRQRHHDLPTFSAYVGLLASGRDQEELQIATDLLTTNETFFFREQEHFDLLPSLLPERSSSPRVWSAASSTGEEAYSISLVLADLYPHGSWEVVGTDISQRVLEVARAGLYPLESAAKIPDRLLKQYCLRGKGEYDGMFTLDPGVKRRVSFHSANLIEELPALGMFDVIFLRNVMIYFSPETKERLVHRLTERLRPHGYLLIGHSESLHGMETDLQHVRPSVYRRAGEG